MLSVKLFFVFRGTIKRNPLVYQAFGVFIGINKINEASKLSLRLFVFAQDSQIGKFRTKTSVFVKVLCTVIHPISILNSNETTLMTVPYGFRGDSIPVIRLHRGVVIYLAVVHSNLARPIRCHHW